MSELSRIALAACVFCLASSAASAADMAAMPYKAPPAAPVPYYDWTGFYAGAFAGGNEGIWTSDFNRPNGHGHTQQTATGFAAGVYGGYNYMFANRIVLGAEMDIGASTATQDRRIYDNDTSFTKYGAFGSVRGRLGYAFDRLLVFGTAGVALGQLTNNIQKGQTNGEAVVWEDQARFGFTAGGGLEYAITDRWVGRLEYVWTDYGKVTRYDPAGDRAIFKNETHLVRLGASYRF